MNRYDAESNFDDALGHAIRWSLRGSVANAVPSDEVWARIKQRVYTNESVAAGGRQAEALPLTHSAMLSDSTPERGRGATASTLGGSRRQTFVRRSRSTVEIIQVARLRRAAGRLLRLCAATWRVLDEHTMSSEMVWRPEAANDARFRLAILCASSWPMCGQMLPTY